MRRDRPVRKVLRAIEDLPGPQDPRVMMEAALPAPPARRDPKALKALKALKAPQERLVRLVLRAPLGLPDLRDQLGLRARLAISGRRGPLGRPGRQAPPALPVTSPSRKSNMSCKKPQAADGAAWLPWRRNR